MKIVKPFFLAVITVSLLMIMVVDNVNSKKSTKGKRTPKGMTLRNHYGTPNIASPYGPQGDGIAQYVQANPDTFAPMLGAKNRKKLQHANDFLLKPGYENMLNPGPVKAGEYTNIAPSATKEVNPEITGPKLEVDTEIEYPTAIKAPVFQGFAKELHPVIAYDKVTGEIIEDRALINRPVYNYENRVANVSRHVNSFYDMRNGERITKKPNIKKHGFNTINEDDWKAPPKKDCERNYHQPAKRHHLK